MLLRASDAFGTNADIDIAIIAIIAIRCHRSLRLSTAGFPLPENEIIEESGASRASSVKSAWNAWKNACSNGKTFWRWGQSTNRGEALLRESPIWHKSSTRPSCHDLAVVAVVAVVAVTRVFCAQQVLPGLRPLRQNPHGPGTEEWMTCEAHFTHKRHGDSHATHMFGSPNSVSALRGSYSRC